jgi:hypothetical protein
LKYRDRVRVPVPLTPFTLFVGAMLFFLFLITLILHAVLLELAKKHPALEPVTCRALVIFGICAVLYLVLSPYLFTVLKYL